MQESHFTTPPPADPLARGEGFLKQSLIHAITPA